MKRSLRNSLVVGALAALAGAMWILQTGGSVSQAAPPVVHPTHSASGQTGPLDEAQRQQLLANVEKVVAMRNYEAQQQRRDFEAAGWTVTAGEAPPDDKLTGYDPSLLKGRERELREQVASTTGRAEDAKNLAAIAQQGTELETRWSAVEGLYRIAGGAGQEELLALLRDNKLGATDQARSLIAPRLQPASMADPAVAEVARLLDSPSLSPLEKLQIATTLAIIAMRDNTSLPADILASLSPAAQALYAQRLEWVKTDLAKAWGGAHGHAHEGR